VLAALLIVAVQLREGGAEPASADMDAHDHAAMTAAGGEQRPVRLTADDARRIGVTFAAVELRGLDLTVEALGVVAYDETRLTSVSPKVEGWVDRLYVDFTGAPVRQGQPLMAIYSPMLVSAQEELVLAARLLSEAGEGRAADNAGSLVESARRRLAYWDISDDEIRRIEATGEITRSLTLHAPASGVVVEKNVVEGDRIMPGTSVYRIADLSHVWIETEVFEKDLGLVREGQSAEAEFETYPGRRFQARVTYIHPTVSLESRTGRVRLELPNPDRLLKPGMYARVTLALPSTEPTLVVPRSAVLSTGRRALVFVRAADGALVPREVTPGRVVGRDVEILAGLEAGEQIVASSAFLIDAESSLGALGSTLEGMTPMDEGEGMDHGDTVPSPEGPAGGADMHEGHQE
jgi:membrane fusion protein, copper/silver efflux system